MGLENHSLAKRTRWATSSSDINEPSLEDLGVTEGFVSKSIRRTTPKYL